MCCAHLTCCKHASFSCPLRPKNISVCSSYGCSGVSGVKRRTLTRKPAALLTNEADKPPVYTEGTDADVEDVCENSSSDCSAPVQGDGFDGFDFFQPRSVARMNSHSSSGSSSANNRTLVDRSADEGDPDAFRGGRSVTLTAANAGSLLSARDAAKAHRSHSERSVAGPVSIGHDFRENSKQLTDNRRNGGGEYSADSPNGLRERSSIRL